MRNAITLCLVALGRLLGRESAEIHVFVSMGWELSIGTESQLEPHQRWFLAPQLLVAADHFAKV